MINGSSLRLILVGLIMTVLPSVGEAQIAHQGCGSLVNSYGPFDYTNHQHRTEKLAVVEKHHFNGTVYRLEGGLTSFGPRGDLNYTLRASPNHHLALDAMARLHRRENTEMLEDAQYSLRCWFDRARRFAPNDHTVLLIEGIHYLTVGDLNTAERALQRAIEIKPQSAEVAYNLGLLYLRKGDNEQAREYAVVAYDNGYPLPGLKKKLIEKGAWTNEADNVASR